MLANYGIQTQTPTEVEPVEIWNSAELVKVRTIQLLIFKQGYIYIINFQTGVYILLIFKQGYIYFELLIFKDFEVFPLFIPNIFF